MGDLIAIDHFGDPGGGSCLYDLKVNGERLSLFRSDLTFKVVAYTGDVPPIACYSYGGLEFPDEFTKTRMTSAAWLLMCRAYPALRHIMYVSQDFELFLLGKVRSAAFWHGLSYKAAWTKFLFSVACEAHPMQPFSGKVPGATRIVSGGGIHRGLVPDGVQPLTVFGWAYCHVDRSALEELLSSMLVSDLHVFGKSCASRAQLFDIVLDFRWLNVTGKPFQDEKCWRAFLEGLLTNGNGKPFVISTPGGALLMLFVNDLMVGTSVAYVGIDSGCLVRETESVKLTKGYYNGSTMTVDLRPLGEIVSYSAGNGEYRTSERRLAEKFFLPAAPDQLYKVLVQ